MSVPTWCKSSMYLASCRQITRYFLKARMAFFKNWFFSNWRHLITNDFFLLSRAIFALRISRVYHSDSMIRFCIHILIILLISLLWRQFLTTLRLKLTFCCLERVFIYIWITLFCFKLRKAIRIDIFLYLYKACSRILRAQPQSKIFLHNKENATFCRF